MYGKQKLNGMPKFIMPSTTVNTGKQFTSLPRNGSIMSAAANQATVTSGMSYSAAGVKQNLNSSKTIASSGPKRSRKATEVSFLNSGRSGMAPKTAGGLRSFSKNRTSAA